MTEYKAEKVYNMQYLEKDITICKITIPRQQKKKDILWL